MKILVTGGAGFIGSNFIRYMLREHPEDQVINMDALTYAGNLENLADVEHDPRYTFVKVDICHRPFVFEMVKMVDAIVHIAAETHVDRSILDASSFVRTNVAGTQTLLDAAVAAGGKRFHHVSTDEVFGALGPYDPPFNEQTPYAPRNPYSATKAASDHLVRSYFHTHKLPVTLSNCSNNYGPYMFPEKLIPLSISHLFEGQKIPVYGDGGQVRDWIFVEDHCRAIDTVLRHGRMGETYLFGGEAETTNLELIRRLLAILGKKESSIEFVKDRPGHDRRYAMDFSKAQQELGWKPLVSLDEGLRRTTDWYAAHQDWVARCKSGTYQAYYEQNYAPKIGALLEEKKV
ncbi:MAG: dTDP-glucose 4,6-dehydratase [Candidatus Uhrbacteria bacterium GW2011_GWF2_41_16]|uniref:dTDP-glucose 4,6-dehydratase n=2 Tax=Candidatus Uhriibacteriota TaxID=1752732 RepID=A0A0G0VAG1_9BACT|nr:MAG: dTDP-glucose 4,6-dehydratase [Candidatus Uhrbacteria bacterium GW2011_GWC2_41_11]KKR97914.1 MAG: dTDP-glucose 4,6-dehydratase [Candidatus Uhrbacteria bacterium GW2011_GWF2_41_16]HBO99599.1 dTDP-glucose 4,6-dehydratase [Candidatus Uhrbacteria bacterium]